MQSVSNLLIRCIRAEIGQLSPEAVFSPDQLTSLLSPENTREILSSAASQDLGHIPAAFLCRMRPRISDEVFASLKRIRFQAVYRYEQIAHETEAVSALFGEVGIDHILLKGAFIRAFYPAPDMRTSCDVDILVSPDDLAAAELALTDTLGYTKVREGGHDVQFSSPTGVFLELHFTLIDEKDYPQIAAVLSGVWEDAVPADGNPHRFVMSMPFAYFYHIAHMVKHYLYGGCGIRTFMDLWVFRHRIPEFDPGEAEGLLTEGGILRFADKACVLAEMWFSGVDCDPEDRVLMGMMEEYILSGGIYGSVENKLKLNRLENTDRGSYLKSRLFPPFDRMKYEYPVLQRHKMLLPVCYVRRWCRLLSKNTAKRIAEEWKYNSALTAEEQDVFRGMLTELGLKS